MLRVHRQEKFVIVLALVVFASMIFFMVLSYGWQVLVSGT